MKKYIAHLIYAPIIVFCLVFANIKMRESEKMSEMANTAVKLAEDASAQARMQQERASIEAARAVKEATNAREAMSELKKCCSQ